jgi:hypothetical protein
MGSGSLGDVERQVDPAADHVVADPAGHAVELVRDLLFGAGRWAAVAGDADVAVVGRCGRLTR